MKLILFVPIHFRFDEVFADNARSAGFDVTVITNEAYVKKFRYPNLLIRLQNLLRKFFLRDYAFKNRLKNRYATRAILKQVATITEMADYALYIRPDLWELEVIQKVTGLSKKNVCYQWDGLDRYPEIEQYIPLFDVFYTFEIDDYLKNSNRIRFTTNFYFDYFEKDPTEIQYDFFYIGSYLDERIQALVNLSNYLTALGKTHKFMIFNYESVDLSASQNEYNFETISRHLSYKETIPLIRACRVLVDLQNDVHKGLSFRIFESMFFEKKLITTNTAISEYDFYCPENIFILTDDNRDDIEAFLNVPYQPVAKDIKSKYSFTNWIAFMLDITPHQKIEIPHELAYRDAH